MEKFKTLFIILSFLILFRSHFCVSSKVSHVIDTIEHLLMYDPNYDFIPFAFDLI